MSRYFATFDPLQVTYMADDLRARYCNTYDHERHPSYNHFESWAVEVIKALVTLNQQLTIELIATDVVDFLASLRAPSLIRPWRTGLPATYTRMYMSNVPDYAGGPLEMALYAVPCLQSSAASSVGMNLKFNGPIWEDNIDDFVYT